MSDASGKNERGISRRGVSRRDVLRNLAIGAAGGSVLQVIPAQAAELAHEIIRGEKAGAGQYTPKFFRPHQYQTLLVLCDAIIPKDNVSGGAVEAGAPEFIDLLTSENEHYQVILGGGLMWLDNFCADRYQHTFLECSPEQRTEVLDLIAFRKNARTEPLLSQGIAFFRKLRLMTCDGFYTAKIGIEDLKYIGNTALAAFPGCPQVPD
ncbi:MAG: gluconate 2-dehydrogenase subunit 3 family protein [Candidatus Acidiferrum sp.]|jgi:gluconate 2-dehydrogenase gamma chain